MSADKWRKKAEDLEAQVDQLVIDGRVNEALPLAALAAGYRDLVDGLQKGTKRSIQREMLAVEPRKSLKYTTDADTKDFLRVANAAGHTLNSVAKAVRKKFGKGSHVNIGKALRGEKSIRPAWAAYIASLTVSEAFPKGFEATPANWPGGWAAED